MPEPPLWTVGDVTLIEQAVSNVVHNAVRYNNPGGHVAVVLEPAHDRFRLRVFDDGPGVPDEALARLRRGLGKEHTWVALVLTNKGRWLVSQGRYDEAEACHREALAIIRRRSGPDHPHAAHRRRRRRAPPCRRRYSESPWQ